MLVIVPLRSTTVPMAPAAFVVDSFGSFWHWSTTTLAWGKMLPLVPAVSVLAPCPVTCVVVVDFKRVVADDTVLEAECSIVTIERLDVTAWLAEGLAIEQDATEIVAVARKTPIAIRLNVIIFDSVPITWVKSSLSLLSFLLTCLGPAFRRSIFRGIRNRQPILHCQTFPRIDLGN